MREILCAEVLEALMGFQREVEGLLGKAAA